MRCFRVFLVIVLFCGSVFLSAEEKSIFDGFWCGQWDNRFKVCFQIVKEKDFFRISYQWAETVSGAMKSNHGKGKLINSNTIQLDNKFLIWKDDHLFAVGLFDQQTRLAKLERQSSN